MKWLSESVEVLVARELGSAEQPRIHPAVVVGSGYGGAVAALRLAQGGVPVLVLERGKEYVPGEFPNDLGDAFGHFRVERSGSEGIDGYATGLFDLRQGTGIGALVGNGLGGTSLINANVVLRPDPRVFSKRHGTDYAWPQALRPQEAGAALPCDLLGAFKLAKKELGAETFQGILPEKLRGHPEQLNPCREPEWVEPLKTKRLRELANWAEQVAGPNVCVSYRRPALTINLDGQGAGVLEASDMKACVGCGECVSGCNFSAKKTLPYTYLPRARQAGARMFTEVTVLSVERRGEVWVVHFVRTSSRKAQMEDARIPVPVHELHARHVVLSAGTLGSTEILLRSKERHGLALSRRLGQRLSTNGDSLAFGYRMKERVNGIGVGSADAPGEADTVGPTITGVIRIDDRDDVERSMLIQDGAIPRAVAALFHEFAATSGTLAQLERWTFRDQPPVGVGGRDARDWAVLDARHWQHTQTLLGIGHDPGAGRMHFDAGNDRLRLCYDTEKIEALEQLHDKYMREVQAQGAIYLRNPVLQPLPPGVQNILHGPPLTRGVFTVHPLGGCCMADDAARGVVDDLGRVFSASEGSGVHTGLYVLDGAIVPTALGANPLLTIAALAERAMAVLVPQVQRRLAGANAGEKAHAGAKLEKVPTNNAQRKQDPPGSVPGRSGAGQRNPFAREVNVNFTEAMRSSAFNWHGEGLAQEASPKKNWFAHLVLHMPVENLELFGADGQHVISIPSQKGIAPQGRERLRAFLRLDPGTSDTSPAPDRGITLTVESGWVSILPVPATGEWQAVSQWVRTLLTWLIERGADETLRSIGQRLGLIDKTREEQAAKSSAWAKFVSLLKLCVHASESRGMEYRLVLRAAQSGHSEQTYEFIGRKNVQYAASWGALGRYLLARGRKKLERPNIWTSYGTLHAEILDSANGQRVGAGVLTLDMQDMTRMHAPQLSLARDTPNALLGLAGYAFWFGRLMLKTRLWDFRLPDYPEHLPPELTGGREIAVNEDENALDDLWPTFPPLRVYRDGVRQTREGDPDESIDLRVRRSRIGTESITLKLTRYRQPELTTRVSGTGMVRAKVLLMLNGFAQSTLGFVPQEHVRKPGQPDDEPGLAEFFYEQGFDVWLFDYRTSSLLQCSKLRSTMDEIAEFDIPAAVNHIIGKVAVRLGLPEEQVQIYAYAHCVGAAAMAMSLLGGFLKHPPSAGGAPQADQLAGVTLSQMQAFLVGSKTAQMRLQVGAFLRDALGWDYVRLSAAERRPTAVESLLDRLFASLPVDEGEECPHERDRIQARPGICTCKRMSGTISRLLKHDRIKPETHDRLPVYFGRANTSVLVHGGRCVENERLVNADGQNVYVTDENIAAHLRMPVALLHGRENALFNVESAQRTYAQLKRVNPDLFDPKLVDPADGSKPAYRLIIAEGFAHFDCTIGYGREMQQQILEPLREFYDNAWTFEEPVRREAANTLARSYAKAALAGPVVGWTRTETGAEGQALRVARLWIEVDESESDKAEFVLSRYKFYQGKREDRERTKEPERWPIIRVPLQKTAGMGDVAELGRVPLARGTPYIAIAVADVAFEADMFLEREISVEMVSVHSIRYPMGPSDPHGGRRDNVYDIGRPLSVEELDKAMEGMKRPRWDIAESGFYLLPRGNLLPRTQPPAGSGHAGKRVVPMGRMSVDDADAYSNLLRHALRRRREAALSADPRTLSRRARFLAVDDTHGRRAADLRAGTLRGANPALGFSFVAACCRHPGTGFEALRADASLVLINKYLYTAGQLPSFLLLLGDQIYADATAGLMDSPSAIEKIAKRHRDAFDTDGFLKLTSSIPTYMVIDDHEIRDNWSTDLLAVPGEQELFDTAKAAFSAYQWASGPRNGTSPGFNYRFEEAGYRFFVLDTRSNRSRHGAGGKQPSRICDPLQFAELKTWLLNAEPQSAQPKFIFSGSVFAPGLHEARTGLADAPRPDDPSDLSADNWQMAQHQRLELLGFIADHGIRNVVFVSGDYHCAAGAEIRIGAHLRAYALVVPPLYAQLPAANAKPDDILGQEKLKLPNRAGTEVTIELKKPARGGDGFAAIRVTPVRSGYWRLEMRLDLLDSSRKIDDRWIEWIGYDLA